MIYVLTYNAPHRKTQDLLFRLKAYGYNDVSIIATPWKKIKNFKPLVPHRNFHALNIEPSQLCKQLGYIFIEDEIKNIKLSNQLFLIGGAGILASDFVNKNRVINSHPAYLPYIRGLDSLKWAIFYEQPIGVTTHIVSEECDAGMLIKQELVPLYKWDTFHSVALRQYELEINMLVGSIKNIKTSKLIELSTEISKPNRRMPNSLETKMLKKFDQLIKKI